MGTQDGIITWGTNPVGVFTSVLNSVPVGVPEPVVVGVPPVPGGSSTPGVLWGGAATSALPLYGLFNTAATMLDWQTAILYVFFVIALAIAMGVAVLITTGSILGGVGTVGIFMFAGTAARILPLWMILVFALLAGTWLYSSKSI